MRNKMIRYKVVFAYNFEIVEVEEETTDFGSILDLCIDQLEAKGSIGCFVNEEDEVNEDEYIIGGNHCLKLYHGGNFWIDKIEE